MNSIIKLSTLKLNASAYFRANYQIIKLFFSLFIFHFSFFCSAQVKDDTLPFKVQHHKILLVPLEANMLMSEIDKSVNAATGMNYNAITSSFLYNLDMALRNAFNKDNTSDTIHYTTVSLLQINTESEKRLKPDTTLGYVYNSIGFRYDLLYQNDSGESHEEFDPNAQKKHFIQQGQLDVPIDYSQRFMNVNILNPNLLPFLHKKYGAGIFMFINEVDIKDVANNVTADLTQSEYQRQITVHYSILNTGGKYLLKGIFTDYFPVNINNPKEIGEKYFRHIADEMVAGLNGVLEKPKK